MKYEFIRCGKSERSFRMVNAGSICSLAPNTAEASNPSRNRTWSDSFEDCHAVQHTHGP